MKCGRTACPTTFEDDEARVRIWNQGTNEPRVYCVRCARKILEFSDQGSGPMRNEVFDPQLQAWRVWIGDKTEGTQPTT